MASLADYPYSSASNWVSVDSNVTLSDALQTRLNMWSVDADAAAREVCKAAAELVAGWSGPTWRKETELPAAKALKA